MYSDFMFLGTHRDDPGGIHMLAILWLSSESLSGDKIPLSMSIRKKALAVPASITMKCFGEIFPTWHCGGSTWGTDYS